MMSKEKSVTEFNKLFSDDKEKAAAFDKIAEKFYYANFGSTSKSDIETLMFSIYIEQILKTEENNFDAYSDYTLSKLLGITQSKVSSLKVRKELQYPFDKFEWRNSLARIADRAVYEDGKIKLFIPDRNLYLEVKNAIERTGGFVEIQLTSNLLQVRFEYFLDLMVAISEDANRQEIKKKISEELKKKNKDNEPFKYSSFGKALLDKTPEMILTLIKACIPFFGEPVDHIAETLLECIRET